MVNIFISIIGFEKTMESQEQSPNWLITLVIESQNFFYKKTNWKEAELAMQILLSYD